MPPEHSSAVNVWRDRASLPRKPGHCGPLHGRASGREGAEPLTDAFYLLEQLKSCFWVLGGCMGA